MRIFVMTFCLVAASALVSGQFVLGEGKNYIADRLEGVWQPEPTLQNPPMVDQVKINEIEFVEDQAEFERFSAFEKEADAPEVAVYFSGSMILTLDGVKNEPRAVVLGSYSGLPMLIFLKDNDVPNDLEFFTISMFLRGTRDDLLFVGGDTADEPMTAFKKIPTPQE